MAETVRGNRASTLRSRIPRPVNNRPDLWAYTSPCPSSFAPPPKTRVFHDLPETSLEHISLAIFPSPTSRIPLYMGGRQDRKTDPEASSEHRARSASSISVPETSSMRARSTGRKSVTGRPTLFGHNWVQALEAEHKKLDHMQSVFMHKLRSLADQGQKLPGVYKFVVMDFKDESKLVLQEGDSKNIPLAAGKDESKKHLEQELASRDLTIADLRNKLLLSEELACEQALRLDEMNSAQMEKEDTVKYLQAELSSAQNMCNQMCSRCQEADHSLEQVAQQVQQQRERRTSVEMELKTLSEKHSSTLATLGDQSLQLKAAIAEADFHSKAEAQLRKDLDRLNEQLDLNHQVLNTRSDMIAKLQQSERNFREKFEDIFKQVGEKNTLINQLNNELEAKEEQFRNVMVTLKEKQGAVKRQENIIKLLEEQGMRTALMKAKHEEKNCAMQLQIAQLKHNLRTQAQFMGDPFFGNLQTENNQTVQQQPLSRQGTQAQEQHQLQ